MLKGKSKIQLFDAATGEQVKCVKDTNMITNAVSKLLNPPVQWGFSADKGNLGTALNNMTPVADNLLGGIMLWEDNLVENAADIIPPNDVVLIGHAGGEYAGTTQTRGTYNTNESGNITDENGNVIGYRNVWDFGTDKANGNINCITLTSRGGGNSGYPSVTDGSGLFAYPTDFYGDAVNINSSSEGHILPCSLSAIYPNSSNYSHGVMLGRLANGQYICFDASSTNIYIINAASSNVLPINFNARDTDKEFTIVNSYKLTGYPLSASFINDTSMIYISSVTTKTIVATIVNPYTGVTTGQKQFSLSETDYSFNTSDVSALLTYTQGRSSIVLLNGYYYLSNGLYIYKFSENGTFVCRLNSTAFTARHNLFVYNGLLYMYRSDCAGNDTENSYVMKPDGTLELTKISLAKTDPQIPIYDGCPHSPYVLTQSGKNAGLVYSTGTFEIMMFRAYIASINNLDVPINKTAAQTMKITYEIYSE